MNHHFFLSFFCSLKGPLRIYGFLLIWLIVTVIGCWLRLYPLHSYASDQAMEQASLLVVSQISSQIAETLNRESTSLSALQKRTTQQQRVNQFLNQNKEQVQRTIIKVAQSLDKQHPPLQNYPYFLGSDSFYYYRVTQEIVETGRLSEQIKGSKYYHPLMLAPEGHWEPINLHPFIGAGVHKLLTFFDPAIPLMVSASYTPLMVMAIILIPYLVICSFLRCSWAAALLGAAHLVTASILLKRSTYAWYDNDPYNALFPFLILSLWLIALSSYRRKTMLLMGTGCVVCIPLYALFWHGWMFVVSILVGSLILILILTWLRKDNPTLSHDLLWLLLLIVTGSFLGISLMFGPHEFLTLFQEGWKALNDFLRTKPLPLWPDLYIGVGELRKASLGEIIGLTGGLPVFVIALFGLGRYFLQGWLTHQQKSWRTAVVLLVFLIGTLIITFGAQRFALLCLIPISILFALGSQGLIEIGLKWCAPNKAYPYRHLGAQVTLYILILTGMSLLITTAHRQIPTLLNRIFNQVWEDVLIDIKEKTPPDSVINSWWPPGHFITATAQRRVTFDGATINQPQAYWMANILLSQDEKEALGLLRMLNTSGNQAPEYLTAQGMSLSQAVPLLKDIAPITRSQAQKYLIGKMSEDSIDALLSLTHGIPPPSYLLLYNELIEKHIQLSFVGNWNFARFEKINADPELRKAVPKPGSKGYIEFLWESAGGTPRYSGPLNMIHATPQEVIFSQGVRIDLQRMHCQIHSQTFGHGIPLSLFYVQGERIVEKRFPDATLGYAAYLVPDPKDGYLCVLMDQNLARSLIMKLYYFRGTGMTYFTPLTEKRDLTGRTHLIVFGVQWEKLIK
jgi:hypothetical protein